jgi:hypothetical protein
MAEEIKKTEIPRVAIESANPTPSRWLADSLKEAMKIYKGLPKTLQIDNSPNRGTNWMRRK